MLLALGGGALALRQPSHATPAERAEPVATGPAPLAAASDAPRFPSLEQLTDAADVVVRAEVTHAERGRWFGGGAGGPRVQSRILTLQVSDVLAGTAPDVANLLVEEEGWLDDGAPLAVDGLAPSKDADDGIWFLVAGGDPDLGAYLVVGGQGRYLVAADGDSLSGAKGTDPLVDRLAGLGAESLSDRLRSGGR